MRAAPALLVVCAVASGAAGCRALAVVAHELGCDDALDCAPGQHCAGEPPRCVAGGGADDVASEPVDDGGARDDADAGDGGDATMLDAGATADAGEAADAGGANDAGLGDAGPTADGGGLDAGPADGSLDAGAADAGRGDAGDVRADAGVGCVPIGHDEDGDAVDDACDVCPQEGDPGQSDVLEVDNGDLADGVGDACDPNPFTGGDLLVLFDGFGDVLDPRWTPTSGTWSVQSDALRQSDTQNSHSLTHDAVFAQDVHVQASVVFDVFGDGAPPSAGVLGRYDVGDAYACLLFNVPPTGDLSGGSISLNRLFNGSGTGLVSAAAPEPTVGAPVRVRMRASEAVLVCDSDSSDPAAVADAAISFGTVGMRVNRASVRYEWIAAYEMSD